MTLRLLGGALPQDRILGPAGARVLSSFWSAQVAVGGQWLPLQPVSGQFLLVGTNSSGTYVERTMEVVSGNYTGMFAIVYKASSNGPLKWSLAFTPGVTGQYRLGYEIQNLTNFFQLSSPSKQLQLTYPWDNYTFSWNDVPSLFNVTASISMGQFMLSIGLGTLSAGSKVQVDPSVVSNNVPAGATAYTFQRKTFYEPEAGRYWVFYNTGASCSSCELNYTSSSDGANWSTPLNVPNGPGGSASAGVEMPSIFYSGQTVLVAWGSESYQSTNYAYVNFLLGTISGASITWGALQQISPHAYHICGTPSDWGIRYVNGVILPTGNLAFSFNYFVQEFWCYHESDIQVTLVNGGVVTGPYQLDGIWGTCDTCGPRYDLSDQDRSIILPYDGQGRALVIYQYCGGIIYPCAPSLRSRLVDSKGNLGQTLTIEQSMAGTDEFSAVQDSDYGAYCVYKMTDGTVSYDYELPSGTSWTSPIRDMFSGQVGYPSITVDNSAATVYVLGIVAGGSIVMKSKSLSRSWTDSSPVYPVTQRNSPASLSSNAISASDTSSSAIELIWTEGSSSPYSVLFASIPIQTVWSPYSSPPDPWNGNGLAPYGQYFANLGESVSSSTGMLTVKQTDLSVSGRGLSLDITRVYAEPYSFLANTPYNYESYPWVPMGNGWQLNFPWLNNTNDPLYIHLWDGEGYRIPSGFWSGFTATFENHQGDSFRLVRNLDGSMNLYEKSGTSYYFNTTSHRLATITDSTGNNTITFSYNSNTISCITDTVNRAFTFSYSNGLLQAINQITGTCASQGNIVRTINYAYSGQSLTSVTDPARRVTAYAYNATGGSVASWLLSRVRYPTSWLTNYTYLAVLLGTQAYTYRVNLQKIAPSPSSPVRQFAYVYSNPVGDQITGSTVTTYNGTQIQSYTNYAFSFAGDTMNTTDSNHNLLRGIQQIFGVNGQIPREIVLVSDGQGHIGSVTNYYRYDLWGNRIYSRQTINNSTGAYHQSFNSYYNDGEPPGFYAFQDSFSQNQGTGPDNSWNATSGYWMVNNGVYNGTETSGGLESMVSSSSIASADLSLQSRVYAVRQINVTAGVLPRLGIFAHYTGGKYKWALDLTNESPSGTFLELHDEWYQWLGVNGQPFAKTSCPLITGAWYTFNMTVHGSFVSGWASTQGQATCYVSGVFAASSPAASGNRFGLSAGGYSALFDDVQAATVTPMITGTGFSNAFFQNGAPGPVGLNTWLATTKPPNAGWNTTANWLPATEWSQAYPVQNYGGPYWNSGVNGWTDNNAQWIWSSKNANYSASADPVWFRRVFRVSTATTLSIQVTADNSFVLYVDGVRCAVQTDGNWANPRSCTTQTLQPGVYHLLAANVTNPDGQSPSQPNPDPAGFLLTANANSQVVFRTDGIAGANIISLAGSAQLQNGPASQPKETYYSYYSWGGVNQTQSRYDPPAGQGSPNPLALDGSASNGCSNSYSSCSATLTTSHASDIIIAYASESLNQQTTACSFSITDTAGLSWMSRGPSVIGRGGRDQLQEFWARSPNALVSDVVTETITGCGNNYNGVQVFGITGANFNNPFDPTFGLPANATGTGYGTLVALSASNPNDIIIAGVQHGALVPTPGTGFTTITSYAGVGIASEYKTVSTTLSNFNVTFGDTASASWEEIADAVQSSPTTQWRTSSRTYDVYGNPKTSTDPSGNVTSYGYSARYQSAYLTSLNQTLVPSGTLISNRYGYNFTTGTVLSTVNPNGYNATYKYDILGRTARGTYPNNDFVSYTYNDVANYVNITNENGWLTQHQYDGLGRLSMVEKFLNGKPYSNATSTYNWQDKTLTTRDPVGNTYYYSYDPLGRITNSTTPDRKSVLQSYNDLLAWVRTTDQDGNYRCNYYDRLGRLISVVEYADSSCNPRTLNGNNYVTNYYYNEVGNLGKVTNAATKSTTYSYDNLNRLTTTGYPDGTSETYFYDNNGNVVKKVDRASVKTLASYDSMNRPSTVTYCGTTITGASYVYDKNGNPLQALNENATMTYIYDSRNRVLNETYAVNPATRTVVDLGCSGSGGSMTRTGGVAKTYMVGTTYNGELVNTIAYPTIYAWNPDITIKYSYDGLGRILNVQNVSTSLYFAQLTYSKADQVVGVQYGNGPIANYTYDTLSRPNTITLKNPGTNNVMMSLTYSYNNTGTVSSLVGQVNSATLNEQYKYDPLQRLVNSTVTNGGGKTTFWYQYDNIGNMMAQSVNGTATNYTYNQANNELVSFSSLGTSTAYAYDQDGNLLNKNVTTTGTVRWYYTWDPAGDLLKVTNSTGQALYAYDGGGRSVEAVESGAVWYFAYAGTEVLYKNRLNTYNCAYIFASGLRIANFANGSTYYYHPDALGSIRMITYPNAAVAYTNGYQPYGRYTGTLTGNLGKWAIDKFDGKPYSSATGLYYYFHRWYDPSIGRFVSQDSYPGHRSDPQSLNPYLYVENSPTTYSDSTGQCPWCIAALIGAAGGAIIGYGLCVANGGGWTSSECGKAALEGAIVGGVIGLTLGLGAVAMPEEQQAADQLVNTSDFWANTESTTTTTVITTDATSSIATTATPAITSTSSDASLTSELTDNALAVRGGLNTAQSLDDALARGGISANSAPGMTVKQLSEGLPHNYVGVTTVGDIRAIGGEVVGAPTATNPFHAILVPGPGGTQELSELFQILRNPWKIPG